MTPILRSCFLALSLAFVSVHAGAAESRVTLNFVNSDIESAVKAIGVITGKNFMIDPKVKGSINIVSNQPVPRDAVYPIFLSALRQQGFAVVEANGISKVLPEADAKMQGGEVIGKVGKLHGGQLITQVYPLKFESANQLIPILKPLVTPNNLIAAYPASNLLVITDYADNVARINRLVEAIDQPQSNEVFSLQLKNANALDVAQNIARLMSEVFVLGIPPAQPVAEGVRRSVIVPDVRTNMLMIRSESAVHTQQIRNLVETFDVPSAGGTQMRVIYLKNAEASRLAATLKGILTGQDATISNPSAVAGSTAGSKNSSSAGASSSSTTQVSSTNVQIGGATVLITADTTTNSLIITAPDHIYNNLRSVVERLDVRRAQVYIEALIAEVSLSKAGEFGTQLALGTTNNSVNGGVVSNIGVGASNLGTLYSGYASSSLSVPSTFNVALYTSRGLGALVTAIESTSDSNVLSTPTLLTLDNEEARISIGQNIPILTGSTTSTSGTTNSVDRKDVGIILKVRPQVSDGGSITLTLNQEVSGIDSSVDATYGYTTKVRNVDTKVLVDSGQIVVLGGLIEDKISTVLNKVPVLGDIPWIGELFRYETRARTKTNLMVFLRPVIVRDGVASAALSGERYEYLRALQGSFVPDKAITLPNAPVVQLPDLNGKEGLKLDPGKSILQHQVNKQAPAKEAGKAAEKQAAKAVDTSSEAKQ